MAYEFAAGGLFAEDAGVAAAETGAAASGTSMFSSMLSSAMPYLMIASMVYSGFQAQQAHREQMHQQKKLAKAQVEQANLLHEKVKADKAELFSAVRSSVAQTTGTMGAVY